MIFDVYPINLFTVAGFGLVGYWLESINGKNGFFDTLLAPAPLAAMGCFFTAFETLAQ